MKIKFSRLLIFLVVLQGVLILDSCLKDGPPEGVRQASLGMKLKLGIVLSPGAANANDAEGLSKVFDIASKTEQAVSGMNVSFALRELSQEPGSEIKALNQLENEGADAAIIDSLENGAAELGEICSPEDEIVEMPKKIGIPAILAGSSPDQIKTCQGLWRISPDMDSIISSSTIFMLKKMKASRIAIINDADDISNIRFLSRFSRQYINEGGTIVDILNLKINDGVQLERLPNLKKSKPLMIFMPLADAKGIAVAKFIREKGIRTAILFSRIPQDFYDWEAVNGISEAYFISPFSFQPTKEERIKRFLDACSKNRIRPSVRQLLFADALFIAADALSQAAKDGVSSISESDNDAYLSGRIGLFGDGSVKRYLYVVRYNGSDLELIMKIKVKIPG